MAPQGGGSDGSLYTVRIREAEGLILTKHERRRITPNIFYIRTEHFSLSSGNIFLLLTEHFSLSSEAGTVDIPSILVLLSI